MPEIAPLLKQLRLSGILHTLEERNREAVANKLAYTDFLALLIQDEVARREQKKFDLRVRRAGPGFAIAVAFEHDAIRAVAETVQRGGTEQTVGEGRKWVLNNSFGGACITRPIAGFLTMTRGWTSSEYVGFPTQSLISDSVLLVRRSPVALTRPLVWARGRRLSGRGVGRCATGGRRPRAQQANLDATGRQLELAPAAHSTARPRFPKSSPSTRLQRSPATQKLVERQVEAWLLESRSPTTPCPRVRVQRDLDYGPVELHANPQCLLGQQSIVFVSYELGFAHDLVWLLPPTLQSQRQTDAVETTEEPRC